MTVPVRKKGITSVLLSSFANKDNSKIERVTFENRTKSNATASNEFYIGKAILQSHLKLFSNFITDIKFRILISYFHTTKQSLFLMICVFSFKIREIYLLSVRFRLRLAA